METHPRNPWIAALFNFAAPGLGQLYCGRLPRALLIACLALSLNPLLLLLTLKVNVMASLAITQILAAIFAIVVIIDAWKIARRVGANYELGPINKTSAYVFFAVLVLLTEVICALGGAFYIRDTYEAFKIPTTSMAPTIVPGDTVIANKGAYRKASPAVGDVVIFPNPEDPNQMWIKRIVALQGQSVEIRDGQIYVDQQLQEGAGEIDSSVQFAATEVTPNAVFVLGDNLAKSKDSRQIGPIALNAIRGRVETRYWPPHRSGDLTTEKSAHNPESGN